MTVDTTDSDRCPADVLPLWLAYLTPPLDDCGSDAARPAMQRRYADIMRRGSLTLDGDGWRRVQARFLRAVLAEVAPLDTAGVVAPVDALWARVLGGDAPHDKEWERARTAAREAVAAAWAAEAAETTRAAAAAVAAVAAEAVVEAAARAAVAAVAAVVSIAARAAWTAVVAWEVRVEEAAETTRAAEAAAWDRLVESLFTAVETECGEHRRKGDE